MNQRLYDIGQKVKKVSQKFALYQKKIIKSKLSLGTIAKLASSPTLAGHTQPFYDQVLRAFRSRTAANHIRNATLIVSVEKDLFQRKCVRMSLPVQKRLSSVSFFCKKQLEDLIKKQWEQHRNICKPWLDMCRNCRPTAPRICNCPLNLPSKSGRLIFASVIDTEKRALWIGRLQVLSLLPSDGLRRFLHPICDDEELFS